MILTSDLITDFRGFTSEERGESLDQECRLTLAGLFELTHSIFQGHWEAVQGNKPSWLANEEAWLLRSVLQLLRFHHGYTLSPLKGPGWQIAYLENAAEIEQHERFRPLDQQLLRSAAPPYLSEGLLRPHAGCLSELITNVKDHSARAGLSCSGALVGFHVTPTTLHYAVADMGRGVRRSLADNPRWDGLEDDLAALNAILVEHASSRSAQGEGEGFKTVIRSLVSQNGAIRLQSGDALATATPRDEGPFCEIQSCAPLKGLRVSVCLRGDGKEPTEEPLTLASPREHV